MTALETTTAPPTPTGAIAALDHLVLTVRDVDATLRFYVDVLGLEHASHPDGDALVLGEQRLLLRVAGEGAGAETSAPGALELCLIARVPVEALVRALEEHGTPIERGPVERAGATGRLLSVYVRDPDGNVVELANVLDA